MKTLSLIVLSFVFVNLGQASLEEILAPLPEPVEEPAAVDEVEESPIPEVDATEALIVEVEKELAIEEPEMPFVPISKFDLLAELERAIQLHYRPDGQLTLMPLRELPDLSDYSQPFDVLPLSLPSRLSDSNIYLRFQVENRKGVIGEWTTSFRPHLFSEVWYISSFLRRGELAQRSDFDVREIDVLRHPDAVIANLEVLLQHEYSRDLRPGKPLIWQDLKERSMVKKGSVVDVFVSRGLLAINMKAIARQDGVEGDVILLQNIESRKEFPARVVGVNRTEVSF